MFFPRFILNSVLIINLNLICIIKFIFFYFYSLIFDSIDYELTLKNFSPFISNIQLIN